MTEEEEPGALTKNLDLLGTWTQQWVNTILSPEFEDEETGGVLTEQFSSEVDQLIEHGHGADAIMAAVTVAAQARRMYLREKAKNDDGETGDD